MVELKRNQLNIDLQHITRVEGHGNLVVDMRDGKLVRCELEVIEAPRYFEAMLHGYPYQQVSSLVSRICGICSVAHTTTSLLAIEKALGVEPSAQTTLLRKLNFMAEMLDSHILHAYMLVIPDFLGAGSVIDLVKDSTETVTRALRMKKLAGDICKVVCGRHTHPISMTVGGFTHFPAESQLKELYDRVQTLLPDIEATVELFQSLVFPDFEHETEYIALTKENEYAFIDGLISNSRGETWSQESYYQSTKEIMVSHSTSKHAWYQGEPFMVGALARFKINSGKLHQIAKEVAAALQLTPECTNPFKITLAQIVEIVHCYYEILDILKELLNMGVGHVQPVEPSNLSGEGVGVCEAPRGTLYHHYAIQGGHVITANCIIPTGQNLANIEADMRAVLPRNLDKTEGEITHLLEMLVRAYDPCISCSTHMLEVKFAS